MTRAHAQHETNPPVYQCQDLPLKVAVETAAWRFRRSWPLESDARNFTNAVDGAILPSLFRPGRRRRRRSPFLNLDGRPTATELALY